MYLPKHFAEPDQAARMEATPAFRKYQPAGPGVPASAK